ncbi:His-Xaa-Ser system radical SAM maturase HxsC [Porcincola intestinalis]|uniref:His-Xaa-Ser system radical SAM maturase HxsC n=1 Tax=Porcincola intestinalis TaxID=2606632 RepID=UPI002A7EE48C|nr:His-Xaa-Ser system radical SAM maturase HxsC [Porcincola intestinalis]MDY4204141.1 His-Xaa-Ser system radical SAM maturase HxsC [Porcincola intestinalis]
MKFRIKNPDGYYNAYSIAISNRAIEELQAQALPFWIVKDHYFVNSYDKREVTLVNSESVHFEELNDYDVLEVFPDGTVNRYYNDSSEDNLFFITEKCNSNCIMCPSPDSSRKGGGSWRAKQLIYIAQHIPADAKHFTITGGEPFMIGSEIFDFFKYLRNRFEETEFLVLTNGRALAIKSYSQVLENTLPYNTLFGIPLHASNAKLHDFITRASGSFVQTVAGIRNLILLKIPVEIRIVVNRLNVSDLERLAFFIVKEFPEVDHVSIMAMEMTGSAYINRNVVWIPYKDSFNYVSKAVDIFIENAINVRLYNYPLCTVQPEYWTLCKKSISGRKIRYLEACFECKMKDACGGMFAGTRHLEESEIKAIR